MTYQHSLLSPCDFRCLHAQSLNEVLANHARTRRCFWDRKLWNFSTSSSISYTVILIETRACNWNCRRRQQLNLRSLEREKQLYGN